MMVVFLQLKNYQVQIEEMNIMNRQEFVAHLRRYTQTFEPISVGLGFRISLYIVSFSGFWFVEKAVDSLGELPYTEE